MALYSLSLNNFSIQEVGEYHEQEAHFDRYGVRSYPSRHPLVFHPGGLTTDITLTVGFVLLLAWYRILNLSKGKTD